MQLTPGRRHQFGVSRFEVAGRPLDPGIQIPEFGAGEVGETLNLVLQAEHTARR